VGQLVSPQTGEYYERAYELLMREGIAFSYADVSYCQWYEVDDADDLAAAEELLASSPSARITASR
jgi:hypothetical protein